MLDQILDSPLHVGIEVTFVLLVLVFLEAVLSADNAIALAAISQRLEDDKLQRQALNLGLVVAYVLRISLILTATWVTKFWQFQVLGAIYLLWLVLQHFLPSSDEEQEQQVHRFDSLWQVVPTIALTDLAFSLDSVTTVIAVSQETWLVLIGATIGIITLRFMAGLFIRWLDEYVRLETAGYLTVLLVGLRLLARVINQDLLPPEWVMISAIAIIFVWGFSQRIPVESGGVEAGGSGGVGEWGSGGVGEKHQSVSHYSDRNLEMSDLRRYPSDQKSTAEASPGIAEEQS